MTLNLETQFTLGVQLILAISLGLILGWDRERRGQGAGLRTHMLVALGACLFTGLSIHAFPGSDPGRIASQILPGLGFIGAGAILRLGANIQGLTTATSIWTTAAIGMSVGAGAWFLAIIATILAWFILAVMMQAKREIFDDNEEADLMPLGTPPSQDQNS